MVSLSDSFDLYLLDSDDEDDPFTMEFIVDINSMALNLSSLLLGDFEQPIADKFICKKAYNCRYRQKCKFYHSEKEKAFFSKDTR